VTTGGVISPPLTSGSGHLYQAGESCPYADFGKETTDAEGDVIKCTIENGVRWVKV
jgi:hypothetical protein